MQLQPDYNKPWAHVADPQVGDIVRIKQMHGGNMASKRLPLWAVVTEVHKHPPDSVIESTMLVTPLYSDNPHCATWLETQMSWIRQGRRSYVRVRFRDVMPAPKRIPHEVLVAAVKYRLLNAVGKVE